jgi:hypothetical protein
MKTVQIESAVWNFFKGKRTYLVGALALVYGWYFKDPQAIFVGLGLFGLRAAISHDLAKLLSQPTITKQDVIATAEQVIADGTAATNGTVTEVNGQPVQ